jgi:TPR repeat protein
MRSRGHVWSRWEFFDRAEEWYRRGAVNGDAGAMFHLAWIYEQAAFKRVMKKAAEIEACFEAVTTPKIDDATALLYLRNEAFAEQLDALLLAKARELEKCFEFEAGPEFYALHWYRRAAEKGFAPAMNNLGQLYVGGFRGLRNPDAAFPWLLAGAKAGNFVAAMNVGMAYRSGIGVKADITEAEKWSTWNPASSNRADLLEPTLQRTHLYGQNALEDGPRDTLRWAADRNEMVWMKIGAVKPNPDLPTFKSVLREIEKEREIHRERELRSKRELRQ